ncbi:MAG TPA: sulfotransferase [Candidatus Limnocylindria bacterium]|jgi:hypothetical protein|nr:sulfotransferase [Candidatus Limnocylindria bacterium]
MTRRPDTFVIGAAKSGTTSLHEYLKAHPQVFMSARKEPRYFSPDVASRVEGKSLRHGRDLTAYLELFAGAGAVRRAGESTTRYLYSRRAPRLVHDFDPGAYIVAMLREPVSMIYSLHGHYLSKGVETIDDFEAALAAEPERAARDTPDSMSLTLYRARGRYGEQLARWYDVFPAQRIHVIVLEEFARQPAAEYRRLLEFLDVDPSFVPDSFETYNARHEPRSLLVRSLIRARPTQWLAWQALPRVVGQARASGFVNRFKGVNRRAGERQPIRPQVRDRLIAELHDDIALAGRLIGRDLLALWWGGQPAVEPREAHAATA